MLNLTGNDALGLALALAMAMAATTNGAEAKKKTSNSSPVEVSEVKLFTQPHNPVCGEPVQIIAEIHTKKPGAVEFMLHRKEGRSQRASLTTQKTEHGYVERWQRQYVYKYSVRREYRIVINGGKLSTNWMPVSVRCNYTGTYKGLASLKYH
ncbi:MAG: hypothetical protein AB3N20_02135 [Rhizobiaceae bacterium]